MVAKAAGYAELASWSSRKGRNVVWEQQNRSKCRPGAAGQVQEQQDRSKCRLIRVAGQAEMSSQGSSKRRSDVMSSRIGRNIVPEQLDRSRCRRKVARRLEMMAKAGQRSTRARWSPKKSRRLTAHLFLYIYIYIYVYM